MSIKSRLDKLEQVSQSMQPRIPLADKIKQMPVVDKITRMLMRDEEMLGQMYITHVAAKPVLEDSGPRLMQQLIKLAWIRWVNLKVNKLTLSNLDDHSADFNQQVACNNRLENRL